MNPIGFDHSMERQPRGDGPAADLNVKTTAVPSVVQVFFSDRNQTLAYYNDLFDLHAGDIVFVDGKLKGLRGRVTAVSTHFKVKAEDYKRVVGRADTHVTGQFYQANAHLITFDRLALPYRQFRSWIKSPAEEDAVYYVGHDDEAVDLTDLSRLTADRGTFDRGVGYYHDDRVRYLCLEGNRGRAVVAGTEFYEVEFQYQDGRIRDLFCDCPCGDTCKHEVAALLQLREALKLIEETYSADWRSSDYFAMVCKPMFYTFAIDADPHAVLSLG